MVVRLGLDSGGELLRARTFLMAVVVAIGGLPGPAAAQLRIRPPEHHDLPGTPAAYGIVFDQWVARRTPKTAGLVVRRGGKTVFVKGHNTDPLQPTLIANLSKPN